MSHNSLLLNLLFCLLSSSGVTASYIQTQYEVHLDEDGGEVKESLLQQGEKIKDAMVKYLRIRSGNREYSVLLEDIEMSVPRVDADGKLRIGSWEFDGDNSVLIYRALPMGLGTYWYRVHLIRNQEDWSIRGFYREEIFK